MKNANYLLCTAFIIVFSIYSCEKEKSNNKQLDFKGQLISKSVCKSNLKSTKIASETPDSLSCIEYSFDNSTQKLTIKHINAGFNCCPDSCYCKISLSNDTILIREIEANPKCNCDCLYDLNIEVQGVGAKKYQIKFIEPYWDATQTILFGVDLTKETVGSFCVTRKLYPWGLHSLSH